MNFNKHSNLEGAHAFLGASKYHWVNYDEAKLEDTYLSYLATQKGTALHALACQCIRMRVNVAKIQETFYLYVNDAIGFKMTPEQPLFYSINCFGTPDAISFRNKHLQIHDLKTGESPTSMKQLEIYAALFCLEYHMEPKDISIELRIYQFNQFFVELPSSESIKTIMNTIVLFDKKLEKMKQEV